MEGCCFLVQKWGMTELSPSDCVSTTHGGVLFSYAEAGLTELSPSDGVCTSKCLDRGVVVFAYARPWPRDCSCCMVLVSLTTVYYWCFTCRLNLLTRDTLTDTDNWCCTCRHNLLTSMVFETVQVEYSPADCFI